LQIIGQIFDVDRGFLC